MHAVNNYYFLRWWKLNNASKTKWSLLFLMLEYSTCCHLVFVYAVNNYYFLLLFFLKFKDLELMTINLGWWIWNKASKSFIYRISLSLMTVVGSPHKLQTNCMEVKNEWICWRWKPIYSLQIIILVILITSSIPTYKSFWKISCPK